MQIRPLVELRYGRINEPVRIPIYPQLVDAATTFLNADTASGVGTLTVKNITNFAIDQILLIGEVGNQNSEIIKTSHTIAPSGTTVTLATNTVFPHSAATKIYILKFDQVEISNAPTVSGVKTVRTTASLVANSLTTDYNDLTSTTGYYYARFKNSIDSTFSPYSDPAPYTGYTEFSARSIIDKAVGEVNQAIDTEVITDEYLFQMIDDCQIESLREYQRWSFMQSFNTVLGLTTENQFRVALPTDCDDQQTSKSIYNFRMSRYPGLIWIDKEEWDALMQTIAYTTLASDIIVGAVTITLTSSGDFTDSGSIKIGANTYSFTANNRATGVLTIAASATTNTAGECATEFGSPGLPQYFTVFGGYAYFFPQVSSEFVNFNFYMDYYKTLTQILHDSDLIVLPDPTVVKYYLEWKILKKISNGEETEGSLAAKKDYLDRRDTMKKKEWLNRKFIWKPWQN